MSGLFKFLGGLILAIVVVLLVGFLAVRRGDIPLDTLKQKYAEPASRYMSMPDGVVVHYRDQGAPNASTLVMIHGFSASAMDWDPWVQRLGGRYRIISLDLPGHGLTSAPTGYQASIDGYADLIAAVTARLGAQKFVIIGNSMGGGVAWDFALRHPERLDGLVLVDAAGWPHTSGQKGSPIIFNILQSKLGRAVLRQIDIKPLIRQGMKSAFVNEALVTPALVDRYADFARAPGHRDILMRIQTGGRSVASADLLAQIRVPTLVMHGRQDRLIPFADGQAFAKAIPGATLIAYDGVGHAPMEQIPDQSAKDLDGWLGAKVYGGAR